MDEVSIEHCPTCELPIIAVIDGKAYDLVRMKGDDT